MATWRKCFPKATCGGWPCQAVGNMFSGVVAARLLCGLLPSAVIYQGDITQAIWETWLQMEALDETTLQEYRSGLPWLLFKLLACSLRSRVDGSAHWCGGQVNLDDCLSYGCSGSQACPMAGGQGPSMLSLTNGNSGLGTFNGKLYITMEKSGPLSCVPKC